MRRNEKNAGDARPEANSTRANWLRPLLSAPEAARGHRDRTPALCRLRPRRRSAESCPLAQEPAWLRFCGSRTARCAGFVLSHSSATRANNGPTPQALTATQRTANPHGTSRAERTAPPSAVRPMTGLGCHEPGGEVVVAEDPTPPTRRRKSAFHAEGKGANAVAARRSRSTPPRPTASRPASRRYRLG